MTNDQVNMIKSIPNGSLVHNNIPFNKTNSDIPKNSIIYNNKIYTI